MCSSAETVEFPPGMYGEAEERANRLTHGLGFLLSVAGTIYLFATFADWNQWGRMISCGLYTSSLMLVYAMSTLSHGPFSARRRDFFRSLDQGCIYFLIVGTCTPMAVKYLPSTVCWLLLTGMWTIALTGFVAKVGFVHRVDTVSVWIYVLLGWIPTLTAPWFIAASPAGSLQLALAGGLSYTLGTVFLIFDHRCRYFHAVWHVFVMTGSVLHFFCVLNYVAWSP